MSSPPVEPVDASPDSDPAELESLPVSAAPPLELDESALVDVESGPLDEDVVVPPTESVSSLVDASPEVVSVDDPEVEPESLALVDVVSSPHARALAVANKHRLRAKPVGRMPGA